MTEARAVTDHNEIRKWAEARGGHPARVETTADSPSGGVLRFDFGEKEESLERLPWEAFFEIFERNDLAVLLQEQTEEGSISRFFKFIQREE